MDSRSVGRREPWLVDRGGVRSCLFGCESLGTANGMEPMDVFFSPVSGVMTAEHGVQQRAPDRCI